VAEEAFGWKVGEEDAGVFAGRGRERDGKFATLRTRKVKRDRLLAFVEAFPIEARAAFRTRPAMEIRSAADHVEADHLRAELQQMQPARRRRDERRAFDDAQAGEEWVHDQLAAKTRLSSRPSEGRAGIHVSLHSMLERKRRDAWIPDRASRASGMTCPQDALTSAKTRASRASAPS
jgi:hypothetical protein